MVMGKVYSNSIMVALNSRSKAVPNSSYPLWDNKDAVTGAEHYEDATILVFSEHGFVPLFISEDMELGGLDTA